MREYYFLALLAFLLLVELIFLLLYRQVNLDEGWYLWASKLVYEGKVLYRDFAYTQTPVLPYVYGLFQRVFGEGLYQGRALTVLLSMATFALSTASATKIAGRWGGICCLGLLMTAFFALSQFTYTATYALTALLLAAAIYVTLSDRPEAQRNTWAAIFMATAIGVRLSVVAAVLPFLIYLVVTSRQPLRAAIQTLVVMAVWLVAVLGVFWLLSGANMLYDILGFHTDRLLRPEWQLLRIEYVLHKTSEDLIGLIGLCVAGACVGGVQLWRARRQPVDRERLRPAWLLVSIFLMALALFAIHFLPRTTDSYYNALQAPLMSVSGGIVLARWLTGEQPARRPLIGLLIGLVIVTHGVREMQAFLRDGFILFPLHNRVEIVRSAAELLRRYTKQDDLLLSFNPHLALEAGLRVMPGYEMAIFAYRPTWSNDETRQYHVVNNERLLHDLNAGATAVALTEFDLEQIYGERETLQAILRQRYRWFATIPGFGPYRDDLQIYMPPQFGDPTPQVAQHAALADHITLLGYDLAQHTQTGQATLTLALYWRTAATPGRAYTVFVQLLNSAGTLATGRDNPPCRNTCPTNTWRSGEFVRDEYVLPLDSLVPGEAYTLQVGMYDPATQQRVAVLGQDGQSVGDSIVLTTVKRAGQ